MQASSDKEEDKVTVLHVKPGAEHRALIYLLRQINRRFQMDDALPDLPERVSDFEYRVLTWPNDLDPNGDAANLFTESTMPRGLLLKRIRIRARNTWEFGGDSSNRDAITQQRFITQIDENDSSCDQEASSGVQTSVQRRGPSSNQIKAIRRQLNEKPQVELFAGRVNLVPVAVPNSPAYLKMAAEAILEFNAKGLILTVFRDDTIRCVSAALLVQAAWRCHHLRGNLPLALLIKKHRAARIIQRAWKACLSRCRFLMLSCIKKLAGATQNLLMGGNMTMDVRASMLLRARMFKTLRVFPEHDIQFFFDNQRRVHLVMPDGRQRGGLPKWLGAQISTLTLSEMKQAYGEEHIVYGQSQAVELLIDGADWKDPYGRILSRAEGIPEPGSHAVDGECVLQISYVDVAEARARACLLLALTFDPKLLQGVALLPLNLSSLARQMPPPSPVSSAATPRSSMGELEMHRWLTVRALAQPPDDSGTWQVPPGFQPARLNLVSRGSSIPQLSARRSPSASPLRSIAGSRCPSPKSVSSHRPPSRARSPPPSPGHASNVSLPRSPGVLRSPSSLAMMPERGEASSPRGSLLSLINRPASSHFQQLPPLGLSSSLRSMSPRLVHSSASQRLGSRGGSADLPPSSPSRGGSADLPPSSPYRGGSAGPPPSSPSRLPSASFPLRGGVSQGALYPPRSSSASYLSHAPLQAPPAYPSNSEGTAQIAYINHSGGGSRASSAPSSPSRLSRQISDPDLHMLLNLPPGGSRLDSPADGSRLASPSRPMGREESPVSPRNINSRQPPGSSLYPSGSHDSLFDHNASHLDVQTAILEHDLRQEQQIIEGGIRGEGDLVEEEEESLKQPPSALSVSSSSVPAPNSVTDPRPHQPGIRPVPIVTSSPSPTQRASRRPSSSQMGSVSHGTTPSPEPLTLKPSTAPMGARRSGSLRTPGSASGRRSSVRWSSEAPTASGDQTLSNKDALQKAPSALSPWETEALPTDHPGIKLSETNMTSAPAMTTPDARRLEPIIMISEETLPICEDTDAAWRNEASLSSMDSPGSPNICLAGTASHLPEARSSPGRPMQKDSESPHHDHRSESPQQIEDPTSRRALEPWTPAQPLQVNEAGPTSRMQLVQTPNTRLRLSVLQAEEYAKDESQMPLLPIKHIQHSSSTFVAIKNPRPGLVQTLPPLTSELDTDENLELRGRPESLVHPGGQPSFLTVNAHQASLMRYQSLLHEEFVHAKYNETLADSSARVSEQSFGPRTVWVKRTGTGHALAPGYFPLTASEMGDLVASMAEVYREVAGHCVKAARDDHSEVMREIREEKHRQHEAMVATQSRQAEVAGTMRSLYSDAWDKAKQARVNQRAIRNSRKQRQAHERSFSQAFVRQTNLLSRHVADGERMVAAAVRMAQQAEFTAARRFEDERVQSKVAANREDILALNQWKATGVKNSGFTIEMQEYNEATERYQRDIVELKKLEEEARLRRVGPAGGTWGSRSPLAALREPLHLSSVVSASEARNQTSLMGQETSRSNRPLTSSSSAPQRTSRVPSMSGGKSSLNRQPSAVAPAVDAGLALLSEATTSADAGEGLPSDPKAAIIEPDGGRVVDYLPTLPFAKGANMTLSKRDKPTGIVI